MDSVADHLTATMTPVPQSKLVDRDGYGTCWSACLASVLDLPEAAVPHFAGPRFNDGIGADLIDAYNDDAPLGYWVGTKGWLWMLGFEVVDVDPTDPSRPIEDAHVIACGLSSRSPGPDGREIGHAVVYARQSDCTYALAHDPYPGGGGLVGEPESFYAVRPLDLVSHIGTEAGGGAGPISAPQGPRDRGGSEIFTPSGFGAEVAERPSDSKGLPHG
ncbi:hypothetical protein B1759_15020 [Rubrivirga sp. SAORIC476]|uniref:hypothetical protein n=1 Tax=Rubrivirga sp. SAORIC476 TaxID=1961794 RepID=UPI000BA94603|nr:hypothetical protein [Rubrivirga sp. SAORIC476]PAP79629.1 hypothetical protein B1759_15020 [Rubrivirga sp. SAORIC476]